MGFFKFNFYFSSCESVVWRNSEGVWKLFSNILGSRVKCVFWNYSSGAWELSPLEKTVRVSDSLSVLGFFCCDDVLARGVFLKDEIFLVGHFFLQVAFL
jgi:hypothetical protein